MSTRTGIIFGLALAVSAGQSSAQSLSGNWLVTVEGIPDNESRTLVISSEAGPDAITELSARYGLTSKAKVPVEARLDQSRAPRRLVVTTPAATTISAEELPDQGFAGTFVTKTGRSFPVKLVRVTDAQLASLAERPTFAPGDSWRYQFENKRFAKPGCQYDFAVDRVTASNVYSKVTFPEGCEVSLTTGYPVASGSVQKFDLSLNHFHHSTQAYPAFSFPLYVGKSWQQTWRWSLNGWAYDDEVSATIEALETVTTPAGTFETLRIRLVRVYRGTRTGFITQTGTLEDTFWYAPRAKNFVRRSYLDRGWADITRELVSFSVR